MKAKKNFLSSLLICWDIFFNITVGKQSLKIALKLNYKKKTKFSNWKFWEKHLHLSLGELKSIKIKNE